MARIPTNFAIGQTFHWMDREFTIKTGFSGHSPRTGNLKIGLKTLVTPCFLYNTAFGRIPHLVHTEMHAGPMMMAMEEFIDTVLPIQHSNRTAALPNNDASEIASSSLQKLASNDPEPERILFLIGANPERLAISLVKNWPKQGRNTIGLLSCSVKHHLVPAELYAKLCLILKPDVIIADEPSQRLYAEACSTDIPTFDRVGRTKTLKLRTRWAKWAKEFLLDSPTDIPIFLGVGGDSHPSDRAATAEIIAATGQHTVMGYSMHLPTPDVHLMLNTSQKWKRLWNERLSSSLKVLPVEKPKILIGCQCLKQLVHAISRGVDLFDNQWINTLTLRGAALIISFDSPLVKSEHNIDNHGVQLMSSYQWILDMNDATVTEPANENTLTAERRGIWRKDTRVISPTCECWTCKLPHSRAYIHHLLKVHDMLAYVLLGHHNLHQLDMFFAQIRASIRNGQFDDKAAAFTK